MSCEHAYALLCVQSTHVPDHVAAEPQGARTPELGPMVAAFLHASSGATGFLRAFLLAWRPATWVGPVADSGEVPQASGKRQTVLLGRYRILSGHAASYMPQ